MPNELGSGQEDFFAFAPSIAAGDGDVAALQIARAELDPQRDAFLDPFPVFHSAAEIALIDVRLRAARRAR